jgi:MoaA/NifB/PqqE/SkfB family radical SAM enzyme
MVRESGGRKIMYRPELVDLKITNRCTSECEYCYQNSHPEGKYQYVHRINQILDILHELRVFEVAIGGGEPMLHPNIFQIADRCRELNITPNLSTRAYEVFKYPQIRTYLRNKFGRVGVSIDSKDQWEEVSEYVGQVRPMLHYVPFNLQELEKVLSIKRDILLLHPKNMGKGENFYREYNYEEVWDLISNRDIRFYSLSVDTMFAKRLEPYWDVPPELYFTEDGIHSKYVDAVKLEVGFSSYTTKRFSFANRFGSVDTDKLKNLLVKEPEEVNNA